MSELGLNAVLPRNADGLNCARKWQINMNSEKYDITDVNGKNKM